jgi:hypothetical protein
MSDKLAAVMALPRKFRDEAKTERATSVYGYHFRRACLEHAKALEQALPELEKLLVEVRVKALQDAENAFKDAYSEQDEPLIGVMHGLGAVADLRRGAEDKK